ncbi:hypothetical protein IV203_019687 [Nitzschia inconspicua]|uniref:Uncharacterized protein n=1 Tax=Nitzschia inconspicua TaxID=303405 RepID=A0A9K3LZK8_9STRA|nr:hypothetical protein IV203_019687 [Nitzschia inconspicua]
MDRDLSTTILFHKSVMDSLEKHGCSKRSPTKSAITEKTKQANSKAAGDGDDASPLIRRHSSQSSLSSVRDKSRFGDGDSKISAKTPSWMAEENDEATLLASQIGEEPTILYSGSSRGVTASAQQQLEATNTPVPPKSSSLFGAVMQKIGSSISSALPLQYQSPQRTKRPRCNVENDTGFDSTTADGRPSSSGAAGGVVNSFWGAASPSGKTIMDIVNNFNSPFRFQSPPKRKHRRLSSPPSESAKAEGVFKTPSPSKRRRRRLDSDNVDNSNLSSTSSSNRFLFHESNNNYNVQDSSTVSRSSLFGDNSNLSEESASNWREIPIATQNASNITSSCLGGMELLDWSLSTQLTLELHAPPPMEGNVTLLALQKEVGWDDALTYWEFRPQTRIEGSFRDATKGMDLLRKGSLGANSRGATSKMMEWSKQSSKQASNLPLTSNGSKVIPSNNNKETATRLIQLVRGPEAKLSTSKKKYGPDVWNHGCAESRQWQRAFWSLFHNFMDKVQRWETKDSSPGADRKDVISALMDTYFYVLGVDHIVLFRIGNDGTSYVPAVVVSRTDSTFREKLQTLGVGTIQILETEKERQTRENSSKTAKSRKLFPAENPTNPLLSPSVNADLEALRRAQVFGESAGADVYVKIKKPIQAPKVGEQPYKYKPTRICGWDDVQVFFEAYLNTLGNISPSFLAFDETMRLPTLMCHKVMGPFENSTMKRLGVFPSPPETNGSAGKIDGQDSAIGVSLEICGPILPCVARKLLLVGRNYLLKDEANRPSMPVETEDDSRAPDVSRYIVLQQQRTTKAKRRSYDRTIDSLVLNQGTNADTTSEMLLECPIGKSFSMAVWDSSRQDVVACKLDDAYPIL